MLGRLFSLTEASRLADISRSILRRQLDQGKFPNAFQNTKGFWKLPQTDLFAAGHKPVQGASGEQSTPVHDLSNEQFRPVHDLSNEQFRPVHDIAQGEQGALKNRVVELENALSIERAHRSAAEQVADAERNCARTAERALRMLERAPEQPCDTP